MEVVAVVAVLEEEAVNGGSGSPSWRPITCGLFSFSFAFCRFRNAISTPFCTALGVRTFRADS